MNKVVRRTLKVLVVVAIVLVVLIIGVMAFLGPIIKTAAEKVGPKVLGVPVTVEKVSVNVLAGSFSLRGLRIGNPPGKGYSTDPLMALGELRVSVKIGSLPGKGPVEVKEVAIIDPKVSYEIVDGARNIDVLMKNMQGGKAAAEPPKKVEPAKVEAAPAEKKEARKVIIDHLEFRKGEVSFRAAMTLHKAVVVPLPSIVVNDIGKSSGGTSIEQAIDRIFLELYSAVGKAVESVAGGVTDGAKAGADAVKDVGKGTVDKIKNLF